MNWISQDKFFFSGSVQGYWFFIPPAGGHSGHWIRALTLVFFVGSG